MLGPALLKFGRDEQKREHLPKIRRPDPLVPGLLRTEFGVRPRLAADPADRDGDDYIVKGQKIWTSYANKADWIFCLMRTDSRRRSMKASGSCCSTCRPRASPQSRSC